MLGNLLKAAIGLVVEAPIALAADVLTLGGSITEKDEPYTSNALKKVVRNVQRSTETI